MKDISTSVPGSRVVPFAALNHELDPKELRAWIAEIAQTGIDGVFLHPRIGLFTPYLSEAWFDMIRLCVEEAERHGIDAWLYDEFPYPSGAAGGHLLARSPGLREVHLEVIRKTFSPGRMVLGMLGDGRVVEAFLVRYNHCGEVERHRRITDEIGSFNDAWIRVEWDSRFYYDPRYAQVYNCPRSGCYQPQAAWQGNNGEAWDEIVAFVERRGDTVKAFGDYVDISSPESSREFLRLTHENYRKRLGNYFGGTVPGIFTDEPKFHHALPWSRDIESGWKSYRDDPDALLALAANVAGATELRRSFRFACSKLFRENWCAEVSNWCGDHGLALCGHISPEEDWMLETAFCGSILKTLRLFHIPGCDLIIPAVGDREHPILNFIPILACSAAAQEGRSHALCELFGANDYGLTVQDMKRIADWLGLFGINFFVPHALFYSIDGERKYDAPPTFCRPSTLWPYFKYWADAVRTTADRLGPTGVVVDVLFIRPMNRIAGEADLQSPSNRSLYECGMTAAARILERGLMLHWLDDSELDRLDARDGKAVVGHARYTHVFYLEDSLAEPETRMLHRLGEAGVRVLTDIEQLPRPLRDATGSVRAVRNPEGRWFAVNLNFEPVAFELEGARCSLAGHESRWMTPLLGLGADPGRSERVLSLDGAWDLAPTSDNCLVLADWTSNGETQPPGPWYRLTRENTGSSMACSLGQVPVDSKMSGSRSVVYVTRFAVDSPLHLRLVVEQGAMRGQWTARLNGRIIERWRRGETYDRFNLEADLPGMEAGVYELRFEFEIDHSTDGMLDVCRLFGDFQVSLEGDGPPRLLPSGTLPLNPADWASSGYPHYSGTFVLTRHFDWSETTGRIFCHATAPLCDQAMIWLNGHFAGPLAWSPWEVDVTEFLRNGCNEIQLYLSNSLRNMIYGEPQRSGLGDADICLCRYAEENSPTSPTFSEWTGQTPVPTRLEAVPLPSIP